MNCGTRVVPTRSVSPATAPPEVPRPCQSAGARPSSAAEAAGAAAVVVSAAWRVAVRCGAQYWAEAGCECPLQRPRTGALPELASALRRALAREDARITKLGHRAEKSRKLGSRDVLWVGQRGKNLPPQYMAMQAKSVQVMVFLKQKSPNKHCGFGPIFLNIFRFQSA